MDCGHTSCRQLSDTVLALARMAASDLPPRDKLELLCIQIGTAQHWLSVVEQQLGAESECDTPLQGPHWEPSGTRLSLEADVRSTHSLTQGTSP